MRKKTTPHSSPRGTRQLRIIAGRWRGKKIHFNDNEGLRPTPDRVRETLFNWLAPELPGARCLDLFAGSGMLALEALSRGAEHVDLIEVNPCAVQQIRRHIQELNANNATVWQMQAQHWLDQFEPAQNHNYDIVFIDPPFRSGLVEGCIKALVNNNVLAANALLYIEMGVEEPLPVLPRPWAIHREKTAGQVCYRLITT